MFFIFDWDGTLCDSTPKIVRCMQMAVKRVGLPILEDAEIMNIIGLGLPEAINALYPGINEVAALKLKEAYSECFIGDDHNPSPFFEGVEETLHNLREQGYHMAVATGKSRKGLDRVLTRMGMVDFFHGSRCADETASKPHPQMLHELLAELRYEPEAAIMVGDTEYDMSMAQQAGVARIAVSYGAHHLSRLQTYEPKLCVDQFSQILNVLASAPVNKAGLNS